LNWVGVTWVRAGDAARATDGASTTDTLGAGVAGVEFRARLDRSKESEADLRIAIYVIVAIVVLFLGSFMYLSMNSRSARETGLIDGRLRPCPGTPNCVVSEHDGKESHAEPFGFSGEAGAAWKNAKESVILLGGRVENDAGNYLWATFRSRIWRFVDDVELRLDAGGKVIHVRSASRVGKGDLGVNRKRVERLRDLLKTRGLGA
jgi:uncharacterized protein (DUF1499 family)